MATSLKPAERVAAYSLGCSAAEPQEHERHVPGARGTGGSLGRAGVNSEIV